MHGHPAQAGVVLGVVESRSIRSWSRARAVDEVNAAAAAGDLSELPAHRFPLDEVATAHEAVEGGAVGKVLVDID